MLETAILDVFKDYGPFVSAVVVLFIFYNRSINSQVNLLKDLLKSEKELSSIRITELLNKNGELKDELRNRFAEIKDNIFKDHSTIANNLNAIRDLVNKIESKVGREK